MAVSSGNAGQPAVEVFYADPVDEHGNVIGTAHVGPVSTPWGPVEPTKIPHGEMAIEDADLTFHAKLPERDDDR